MKKLNKITNNRYLKLSLIFILLILISVISVVFLLHRPLDTSYSDIRFHYSRIQGMGNYFSSPVNFKAFGNQGKVINAFYPIITLLPFNVLSFFTKNFNVIYKLIWLAISIFNSLIAFYVMKKFTKSDLKGLLFAAMWTLGVSRIDKIYYSNALGNVYAMAFLPIILLGIFYVFFDDYKKWYFLVIGILLVGYTHMLTLVLMAMFCAILAIGAFIYKKRFTKKRIKYIVISIITIAFGLLATFVPMFEQKHAYDLIMPRVDLHVGDNLPMRFFQYSINNVSALGIINLIVVIYFGIKFKTLSKFERSIYVTSVLFVVLSTSLAPWILIRLTPLIQIQDTERLYTYSNLGLAFILANQFDKIFVKNIWWASAITITVFAVLAFSQSVSVHNIKVGIKKADHKKIIIVNEDGKRFINYPHRDYANKGYEFGLDGNKNYDKKWAKIVRKKRTKYILNNIIINPKIIANSDNMSIKFSNPNSKETILTTKQSVHYGLMSKVNGKNVKPVVSKYGNLQLKIPAEKSIIVRLSYKYSMLTRISQLISFSVFGLIFALLIKSTLQKNNMD